MARNSGITWTDDTFNPWIGCARISPACDGCYAAALMGEGEGRFGRAVWGGPGKGVGTRTRTSEANWNDPVRANKAQARRVREWLNGDAPRPAPFFVFCSSLADVFDSDVPPEWRRDLFELIRATPYLTWLLLTKRPGNIVVLYEQVSDGRAFPSNAAIGCTVVTQREIDRDGPKLLHAKRTLHPAFAFFSIEPMLEEIDARRYLTPSTFGPAVDWVIVGGETTQGEHKARPVDPAWVRSMRDQCAEAGVVFHFKQWGSWEADALRFTDTQGRNPPPRCHVGPKAAGRTLDGRIHNDRPHVPLFEEAA